MFAKITFALIARSRQFSFFTRQTGPEKRMRVGVNSAPTVIGTCSVVAFVLSSFTMETFWPIEFTPVSYKGFIGTQYVTVSKNTYFDG